MKVYIYIYFWPELIRKVHLIHINILFCSGWQFWLPRVRDHITKPQNHTWKVLVWVVHENCPQTSENIQPIVVTCGCAAGVKSKYLLVKTYALHKHGPWASTDLKWPFLRTNIYGNRRCHANFLEREKTSSTTQVWCLWSTSVISIIQLSVFPCGTHNWVVTNSFLSGVMTYSPRVENHA